jgi:hypothetical protein
MKITLKTRSGMWDIEMSLKELEVEFNKCVEMNYPEEIDWTIHEIFATRYKLALPIDECSEILYEGESWKVGECHQFFTSLFRNEKLKQLI